MGMLTGDTFEIGTQIISLQIDGFLQRLDVKYHPSLNAFVFQGPGFRKKVHFTKLLSKSFKQSPQTTSETQVQNHDS